MLWKGSSILVEMFSNFSCSDSPAFFPFIAPYFEGSVFFFLRIFTIHLCCGNRGDGSPSDHQLLKVLDGLDRQKGVAGGRCGWVPGFPAGGAGPRRPAFDMPSGTAAQWAPELIIRRY